MLGEYAPNFVPHLKANEALEHVGACQPFGVVADWISAADLVEEAEDKLARYDGIWIAPGSPYKSMQDALNAIRYGREIGVPVLGTCGGCQHMVIEYARNVLGFADAEHAEHDPYASNLFITPLYCSLVGQAMEVYLDADSRVAAIYTPCAYAKSTIATSA